MADRQSRRGSSPHKPGVSTAPVTGMVAAEARRHKASDRSICSWPRDAPITPTRARSPALPPPLDLSCLTVSAGGRAYHPLWRCRGVEAPMTRVGNTFLFSGGSEAIKDIVIAGMSMIILIYETALEVNIWVSHILYAGHVLVDFIYVYGFLLGDNNTWLH
ncbi:hypothetical protein BS78_06G080200 [Paspalum vaginatum]|nr:hypothetical protein BS78_06G080200 [Paspalum vaginatum]